MTATTLYDDASGRDRRECPRKPETRNPAGAAILLAGHGFGARILALLMLSLVWLAPLPALAGSIAISDAVAHFEADPEHGDTIEIFMNVANSGGDLDRIYAVRSKIAAEGRISGGVEKKSGGDHADHLLAASIDLPAGATTELNEDGSHIELTDLKKIPDIGDVITITLFLEQAGRIKVKVTITEEVH